MKKPDEQMETHKVTIIGAGPIGLACAIELKKRGIRSVLLDKGAPLENLRNWPQGMQFFSSSDKISLGGLPFISAGLRPTREEALKYYLAAADYFELDIRPYTPVRRVEVHDHEKIIHTANGVFRSDKVVFATGYYDHPRRLGVPGEDLPHVSHYLHDPFAYARSRVVIVGGSHSAADAALMLYRCGAEISIVHRGPELSDRLKYWVRPDLENRIAEGSIRAFFNSALESIDEQGVTLRETGKAESQRIESDFVLLFTGYEPGTALMQSAGVHIDPGTLKPALDTHTLESNVPGLFIAGSPTAGHEVSKVFIENGRAHAVQIARAIAGN